MTTNKLLTIPQPFTSDYDSALRAYFDTYTTNFTTFFYVNLSNIVSLRRGSPAYMASFNINDILSVYDPFFAGNGAICLKSYNTFLKRADIAEGNRYAHQGASHRLQTDLLEAKLAAHEPHKKKKVVPSLEWLHSTLTKRLKALGREGIVEATRLLPAFFDEITELQAQGCTQTEIASELSKKSVRPILQSDICRFLQKVDGVREEFEGKRRRAAMTLAMAEDYIDTQELRRRLIRRPRKSAIN